MQIQACSDKCRDVLYRLLTACTDYTSLSACVHRHMRRLVNKQFNKCDAFRKCLTDRFSPYHAYMPRTTNTNTHSGTSAPVLLGNMESLCRQLLFVRRGEARQGEVEHYAALSLAECALALRSASSGILGSQTVSPVNRLVWTESPTWCKTKQHSDPLEPLSVGQQCVLNSHKIYWSEVKPGVTLGCCSVDVSEVLELEMGQNDKEAQSHTLTAFLQDPPSLVDREAFPAPTINIAKEKGTLQDLFVLLVSKCNRSFIKHLNTK